MYSQYTGIGKSRLNFRQSKSSGYTTGFGHVKICIY